MKWQTWPFRFPVCDPAKSEYDSPFVLLHYLDVRKHSQPHRQHINLGIVAGCQTTNEGLILRCIFVRGYSTLTHRKIASGKVPIMKRREMMTSNQPQHPSLPEFLSEERAENALQPVAVRAQRGSTSDAPVCLFPVKSRLKNSNVKWCSETAPVFEKLRKYSHNQAVGHSSHLSLTM